MSDEGDKKQVGSIINGSYQLGDIIQGLYWHSWEAHWMKELANEIKII